MFSVVHADNQVSIPPQVMAALNIRAGSTLRWEVGPTGVMTLHLEESRAERARRLSGIGKDWLAPGQSAVEDLIRERVADDEE